MKKCLTGCLAAAILLVPAAGASAHDAGSVDHRNKYLRSKSRAVTDNWMAPGRDIVRNGMSDGSKASKAEVDDYFATLRRMIAPPPAPKPVAVAAAPASTATASSAAPAASPSYSGGTDAIPSAIVQCESGGSYTATNPSSTAAGKYQIIDSTWHGLGGPDYPGTHDAAKAPPALQDQLAAKLWAGGAGAGNWVCKG